MAAPGFCPSCGYDLAKDEVIERGALRLDPRGEITWHGAPVMLTPAEHLLLSTLVKAQGRPVRRDVLLERTGADCASNVADVQLHRIRGKFAGTGHPAPIETVRGHGWRWAA